MQRMPDKMDSKFRFVLVASERAEQLLRGARPKVDVDHRKPARVAMDEVANDMVYWDYGPQPEDEAPVEEVAVAAEVEAD